MARPGPIVTVLLLLFGPAVLSVVAPRAGLVSAACAVVVLVWLVLRNERRGNR